MPLLPRGYASAETGPQSMSSSQVICHHSPWGGALRSFHRLQDRQRIDSLIGDTCSHLIECMGEQDNHAHEHQKNDGQMRDLVADLFIPIQECLQYSVPCSSDSLGQSFRGLVQSPRSSVVGCSWSWDSATDLGSYRVSAAANGTGPRVGRRRGTTSEVTIYVTMLSHVNQNLFLRRRTLALGATILHGSSTRVPISRCHGGRRIASCSSISLNIHKCLPLIPFRVAIAFHLGYMPWRVIPLHPSSLSTTDGQAAPAGPWDPHCASVAFLCPCRASKRWRAGQASLFSQTP